MKRKKRKKWKERKRKNENKEKNRRKERRIPDQRLKRSKKGKRSNFRSMKKEDRNSSKPECHSESFLTGNIPLHMARVTMMI